MQGLSNQSKITPDRRAETIYPIAIIGAGASGMLAAIAASKTRNSVVLLEKEERVGRKLLATGNGRCNLLNINLPDHVYHGSGKEVAFSLLGKMPPEWLLSFFSTMGLLCRQESDGRCYPHSGQAASVLDALRFSLVRFGVDVRSASAVTTISGEKDNFSLHLTTGQRIRAKRVLFAAGGKAAPTFGADGSAFQMMAALGHSVVLLRPALAPLKVPADRVRGLKGVRVQGKMTLRVDDRNVKTETGEILFTEYGLSGIAAMQLSRGAGDALLKKQRPEICLHLLDRENAYKEMRKRLSLFAGLTMESIFTGLLPKQVGLCLLREIGCAPGDAVTESALQSAFALLPGWTLPVTGVLPFQNAQVTAGGLDFSAFDVNTLESKWVPGLYACGEALDVDGDCGGYNLMWAWVSGITAGESAAGSL